MKKNLLLCITMYVSTACMSQGYKNTYLDLSFQKAMTTYGVGSITGKTPSYADCPKNTYATGIMMDIKEGLTLACNLISDPDVAKDKPNGVITNHGILIVKWSKKLRHWTLSQVGDVFFAPNGIRLFTLQTERRHYRIRPGQHYAARDFSFDYPYGKVGKIIKPVPMKTKISFDVRILEKIRAAIIIGLSQCKYTLGTEYKLSKVDENSTPLFRIELMHSMARITKMRNSIKNKFDYMPTFKHKGGFIILDTAEEYNHRREMQSQK